MVQYLAAQLLEICRRFGMLTFLQDFARKWMFTVGKTRAAAILFKTSIWLSWPLDGLVGMLKLPPAMKPSFQSRQGYEECLMLLGRFAESAAMHKEDVKSLLQQNGEDVHYACALGRLAHLLLLSGEIDTADRLSAEAIDIAERCRVELKHADSECVELLNNMTIVLCAEVYFNRALIQDALERTEEALNSQTNALHLINSRMIKHDSEELEVFLTSYGIMLGIAHLELKEYEKARTFITKGLDLRRRTLGTNNVLRISGEAALGKLYCRTGRLEEAEPLIQMALDTMSWCPDYTDYLTDFAMLRQKQGRIEQSIELYESALKLSHSFYGADHPLLLKVLNPYLELVHHRGDFEAEKLLREKASLIRSKWKITDTRASER